MADVGQLSHEELYPIIGLGNFMDEIDLLEK